jgi:ABC-type oligopeptide transport system substrate-binding subunit
MTNHISHPLPRHIVEAHGERWTEADKIATNGPFRLVSWDRGESLVITRNPEYNGPFHGNIERVELKIQKKRLAQSLTILENYAADDLDILGVYEISPETIDLARQRHAGDMMSLPSMSVMFLMFDFTKSPFTDSRVRQAFVLAIDREKLSNVVLSGYLFPATGGFIPPGLPGHSEGIALPYDPETARKIMSEAGYPEGRDFPPIRCLAPATAQVMIKWMLDQWRKNLGVEITWESVEWPEFLERLQTENIPEMCWHMWVADIPDPENFMSIGLGASSSQLEDLSRLLDSAKRATDQDERMKLYQQADKMIIEQGVIMPLTYGRWLAFVKPWVSKSPLSAIHLFSWKDVILDRH